MSISQTQIESLAAALRGETVQRAPESGNPNQCYHVGAVWYGDWRKDDDQGGFGTFGSPKHNACIMSRNKRMLFFTLAPITSERKTGAGVVELLPGTIPGGKYCASYLLAKLKLFASRNTLRQYFIYKCNLAPDILSRAKETMKS